MNTIRSASDGKYSSTARPLTVIAPIPAESRTRATARLRRPVALVILVEGSNLTKQRILDHCGELFAKWQLPDDVIFVQEIPLTSTGKIDKKVIRADLAQQGYQLPDLREA